MNGKRILALAGLAALISSTTLTANAATVNKNVTVKWNTQAVATLTLNSNYDATGAQQLTAPTILTQANAGSGSCTAAGAGSEVAATVNFGNVTPDSSVTTDCMYENAVNAQIATNSTNWSVTEGFTGAMPAGYSLCALANNAGKAFPFPVAATLPATQSKWTAGAPANTTVGSCTTGSNIPAFATPLAVITAENTAFTAATPANIGEDIELLIGAAAATGAQTATVQYQLVAN